MKIEVFRQVIGILCSSTKSYYILESESKNKRFKFNLNDPNLNSMIGLTISNPTDKFNSGLDVNFEYDSVEELCLVEMNVTKLTEIKRTINGLITKEDTDFLYREIELFLKIFKVLKENAVFVIQNEYESRTAYYINSKVLYTEIKDDTYELVETDIFKLYSSMPRCSIVLISQVPKRLNRSQFIIAHNKIADSMGMKFRNIKSGVGVA